MRVEEFDYPLPPELIAQHPTPRRDASRLLVVDRHGDGLVDSRFSELTRWLEPGDLLVFNDTRVVPARLVGTKPSGGQVELLLLDRVGPPHARSQDWRCLLRASRKPRPGAPLDLSQGLRAVVTGRQADAWLVRLEASRESVSTLIERVGRVPLPPYIRRVGSEKAANDELALEDRERYQTVFAERPGAVAAPTAGLHFTRESLEALARMDVRQAFLTLHVGPGTFEPIRSACVEDHVMQGERFDIPAAAADAVRRTRERGGRVIAVGTTVVRALEHSAAKHGEVRAERALSHLFIFPGFRFRVVDGLLTNFHLPRSTPLMLVSAFAGRERVLGAYRHAVEQGYRFYSYGDAMLVSSPRLPSESNGGSAGPEDPADARSVP